MDSIARFVQREPARIIGLVTALAVVATILWAPLDATGKAPLVGLLVYLAHELVRTQVTPSDGKGDATPGGAP